MQLTIMGQYAKSLPLASAVPSVPSTGITTDFADEEQVEAVAEAPAFVVTQAEAERELERLKWFLWPGHVFRALQVIEELADDLAAAGAAQTKLATALREFDGYLRANGAWITNDGERYRYGEAISSAFVELAVNQVVSKRMVKKQQMRWTPEGARTCSGKPARGRSTASWRRRSVRGTPPSPWYTTP